MSHNSKEEKDEESLPPPPTPAMYKLPPSWAWTTLDAVSEPHIEQLGPQTPHFTYIDIGSIDNVAKRITKPKLLPAKEAPSRARQNLCAGDVLVSSVRPNLNAVAQVPLGIVSPVASTGFVVLRPKACVCSEWLLLVVRSEQFVIEMMQLVRGTYPAVRARQVRAFRIPLPPLAEQRRIVSRQEEMFGQSQQVRAHLAEISLQLLETRQSILEKAFSGRLTADWRGSRKAKWPRLNLRELIAELQQGWSPRCDSFPASPNKWGIIKTTAIQPMAFVDAENKALPAYFQPRSSLEIKAGDVLITRKGPRARAGVTTFVSKTRRKLMVCDTAYRLRVKSSVCEATLLAYLLNSPSMLEEIDKLKSGVSESGVGFTQADFLALTVSLPPLQEQREIVRRLDAALAQIDIAAAANATAIADLDRLDQTVIVRALNGRLVVQNPADEPVSILLDRLAIEAAAKSQEPKKRMPRKAKSSAIQIIRPILDVLRDAKAGISPEDLFHECGRDETDLEQIEKFYAELRLRVNDGKVMEKRPNEATVLLTSKP
jgi:type I restriction enzyme S subunit